jgi:16S rRNA (guanine527-N7)-methyltransferase
MTDFTERVVAELGRHRPAMPEGQRADMARFCTALHEANRHINLTGIDEPEAMAVLHVLDSLALLPLVDAGDDTETGPWLDLGSGCGVPGLPLALARPGLDVVLAESRQRKAAALAGLVETLGLAPRVSVVADRGERWLADHAVDTVVTRAVGSVASQLTLLEPVAGSFRRLVMMKGPAADEELDEARRRRPGLEEPERHEVELPEGAGRRILLVFPGGG